MSHQAMSLISKMNLAQWYGISLAGMLGIILFHHLTRFLPFLYRRTWYFSTKYVAYPLVWPRMCGSTTRMQALFLLLYVVWNVIFLVIDVHQNRIVLVQSVQKYSTRLGIMASINMIPLFLGGRTSSLADGLGVPLHAYYLVHHWVGRVVVFQGLLHAILVLGSGTTDVSIASGITVGIAFLECRF